MLALIAPPKHQQEDAMTRVTTALQQRKTRVIDVDNTNLFGNVRHDIAQRVQDASTLGLVKLILKASG